MASKTRRRAPQQVHQSLTDYETDSFVLPPPQDKGRMRTNDDLNIAVLRRHYPPITTILSIAPYAVVYLFSPASQSWEKSGVEGTLFICAEESDSYGAERFSVAILNRRGLENFKEDLRSPDDIEITEEYVILKGEGEEGPIIYGLWIFSEPEPSSTATCRVANAAVILECAKRSESSRALAQEKMMREEAQEVEDRTQQEEERGGYTAPQEDMSEETVDDASVLMGRQVSLRELFGVQRELDSGFSTRLHDSPDHFVSPEQPPHSSQQHHDAGPRQVPTPQFTTLPDTDFFRSGPRFSSPAQGHALGSGAAPVDGVVGGGALLEDMFRKARQVQQNGST